MKIYASPEEIPIPKTLTGRVAIKLHMGDKENKTFLRPGEVRPVFQKLKGMGCEPFLFDTTTMYKGGRYTPEGYLRVAKLHGFGGFLVVIARDDRVRWVESGGLKKVPDGLHQSETGPRQLARSVKAVNLRAVKLKIPIPEQLLEADSLLVLSHATGHILTKFAAAIKNMAMGCVAKGGKALIHGFARPVYHREKCLLCGACVKACGSGFIKLGREGVSINLDECYSCGRCAEACPRGALEVSEEAVRRSYDAFGAAAKAVVSQFPPERVFFITVLKRITERCDCAKDGGRFIAPDMGFIAGKDPLELDIEAAKLIKEKNPRALDWERWEWFVEAAKRYFKA